MDDNFDADRACEEIDAFLEAHQADIESMLGNLDVLSSILETGHTFYSNMHAIEAMSASMKSASIDSNFAWGTLLVAIFSAYEGAAHGIIRSLIQNNEIWEKAKAKQLAGSSDFNKRVNKLLRNATKKDFLEKIQKITLNNPGDLAGILRQIFGFPFPVLESVHVDFGKILNLRNSYAHRGGATGDQRDTLGNELVFSLHEVVLEITSRFLRGLPKHVTRA